ncbi:MAG: hypothetical protein JO131_05710 [Gammaproteobacteria bacterium]|nr:hypothetical protein [Gammaproteobacteria bacterium]
MFKKYNNISNFYSNIFGSFFKKIINQYKILIKNIRITKPLRIIEINQLSSIPGETKFIIQITNKNVIFALSAAEIINKNFDLNDFPPFHANIVRQAALGKLLDFLSSSETEPLYKIISKKLDLTKKEFIFTIETKEKILFNRTAEELSKDNNLLRNMNIHDIYDIGYTQGSEQILKEKTALLLIKKQIGN